MRNDNLKVGSRSILATRAGITFRNLLALAICALTVGAGTSGKQKKHDADSAEASALAREGDVSAARSHFIEAVGSWEKAATLYGAGAPAKRLDLLLKMTAAYQRLGFQRKALDASEACVELAETLPDAKSKIAAECARGNVLAISDPKLAIAAFDRALALAENQAQSKGAILNDRGNARARLHQTADAILDYKESAELSTNRLTAAQVLLNAAGCALSDGDRVAGQRLLENALDRLGTGESAPHLLIKAALIRAELEPSNPAPRGPGADELLEHAKLIAKKAGDVRTVSLAAGEQANLWDKKERRADALRGTRRAIFDAQRCGASELIFRWEWQLGRILRRAGEPDQSLAAYRRAIRTFESGTLRHDLALAATHQSGASGFRRNVGAIFYEAADLLLESSDKLPTAEQRQERLLEARNVVELLKSAELDDYFKDPCQSVLRGKLRDVSTVSPKTAVLYPVTLGDRLELLVTLPDGEIRRVLAPISGSALQSLARDFQDKLRTRTTYEFITPARQLYELIMTQLDPLLEKAEVDTLVFVPDGPLRMIPLGALYDGTNFLASKFAVAVTPGLTLMDPQAPGSRAPNLLLNGLSEARLGFSALPSVAQEIEEVSDAFGGMVLTNQYFTAKNIRAEFNRSQYSIVHLATHGQFESEAAKSFVLTYDSQLSLDGLESLIRPSAFRGRPVELLTLSACQTAAGNDLAALGLAGVAIKAGARSALATLWCVHDEASAALMASFYTELKTHPTLSKAKALQRAQLSLMQNPNYRHPYYWSAFLLIGNWL